MRDMDISPSARGAEAPATTLASTISAHLREAIKRGEFRPGQKLHVDALRERFAVSLSPIREALSRLASTGLIHTEDQRGYRVAGVSDADLAEVIKLRMELEPFALREAMKAASDEWREILRDAWDALSACVRTPGNLRSNEEWEVLHRHYHLAMLSGCGMPMLVSFVTGLHDMSDRYRRLFLKRNPPDRNVLEEHRRIYEATISDETELACALLRQHIQRTGQNVQAALGSSAARY